MLLLITRTYMVTIDVESLEWVTWTLLWVGHLYGNHCYAYIQLGIEFSVGLYVTGFVKRGLIFLCNFSTLRECNSNCEQATALETFSHL